MKANIYKRAKWLSVTYLSTCLFLLVIHNARADYRINSGTTLLINTGIAVFEYGNASVLAGGDIDNQGTLIIKGNLVNQNGTPSDLGPGIIEFSGGIPQTITGKNIFGKLTLNNSNGLTLLADQQVNGTLTLTSGLIKLGTSGENNLLLGPLASIGGTPSATAMVVATGTGEFRKEFSPTAMSFTYPVGDADGTAEYSPVTANFASGSFPSGNFVGVKLEDASVSDLNLTAGTHITRNWTLNNNIANPITGFSCTGSFHYLPADVVLNGGAEGDLYLVKVSPLVTYNATNAGTHTLSGTLTSLSQFTGAEPAHEISLAAFLEGPYNAGAMNTTLNSLLPLSQPYNTPPWNYGGSEFVTSMPTNIVDWVLIELRQADVPANASGLTVISTRAALITSTGAIVDMDGTSPVKFYGSPITTNLFPVIRHRNHLAIMSNSMVSKTNDIYTYDFSSAQSQIYDGTGNGCIQLGSKWGMIAGNADGSTANNNDDLISWQTNFSQTNYNKADFDFNGSVNNDDLVIWQKNFSQASKVPN